MNRRYEFKQLNPIVSFVHIVLLFVLTMLTFNPIIILISLIFSIINCFIYYGRAFYKGLILNFVIIILMGLINPIISHNGKHVLFVLLGNYTLESMIFGLVSGSLVSSVINHSRVLGFIIDTGKFNYLFGRIMPKTSLVMSISYNYIPRLKREHQEIDDSLKALGYYSSPKRRDLIRGKLKSYSMLITWSLENSIETADSMVARGFTTARRTYYLSARFRFIDYLFLAISIALGGLGIYSIIRFNDFVYYPLIKGFDFTNEKILMYVIILAFNMMIVLLEGGYLLRWHYLKSKI